MPWTVKAINRVHADLCSETNKEWKEPFIFVQGADPQFGMFADYQEIKTTPKWAREIELAELAVMKINEMTPKPKFYVICGDHCHSYYDESPGDRAAQDVDFKRVFSKLDPSIPLVCICGNHDIGDNPTEDSIKKYKYNYGDDYFSFHSGGVFFICINSQFYREAKLVPTLVTAHDRWLNLQLDIARQSITPTIMLQHVPWFISNPHENVKNHNEIEHNVRMKMLDKLIASGVKYVFCGHLHRNSVGRYKDLECVSTSAIGYQLGSDQSGMRVVKVYKDRVEHQYYGLSELPTVITL